MILQWNFGPVRTLNDRALLLGDLKSRMVCIVCFMIRFPIDECIFRLGTHFYNMWLFVFYHLTDWRCCDCENLPCIHWRFRYFDAAPRSWMSFAALQVELRQLGTHRASTWVKQWMPLSQKTSPPKRGSRVWFDSLLMHRTCKVIKVGVFLVGYQKPLMACIVRLAIRFPIDECIFRPCPQFYNMWLFVFNTFV